MYRIYNIYNGGSLHNNISENKIDTPDDDPALGSKHATSTANKQMSI
jgi:hypothetical protein